ncbi:hypothetical protein C2S51_012061 [Perilla frutescens var. frutescens]|nr:hypothetical protein C2S51_012061 [Perilla frutescens var. frutescens]
MAFATAPSLLIPISPSSSFPFRPSEISSPKLPLCPLKFPHSIVFAASSSHNQPPPPFTSDQAVLDAIAGFGDTENFLPLVRSYENDLARLTLVGAVDSRQALTAAAADGGGTADEHLSAGMAAMVVETIYPGPADDSCTVATRLFLPTIKVKEKAIKLRKSLAEDMFQGISSKNILSMTFRQAVLQQLWSFELALFEPGTERNMHDLENPREVPVSLALSSSDDRVISEIGEVVCAAALENTEKHFLSSSANRASNRFSSWFNKRKHIISNNSSVILYDLVENEILANAKILHEKFNSERGKYKLEGGSELKKSWLSSIAFSELEKIGGPEFCAWISECVPSFVLEIDENLLNNVKFEGWNKLEDNRWDVALTHSQMVSLVGILDLYYEDTFTLPEKRLPCYAVAKSSKLDLNKGSSLLKTFSTLLMSGILFVTISVLGKLCLPRLPIRNNFIQQNPQAQVSDIIRVPHHSPDLSELETCCVSIIRRIKDSFGWPGEIRTKSSACAFVGELPKFLSEMDYTNFSMADMSSSSMPLAAGEEEMKELEDIASYQVVVSSSDWKIIGFQPTNRVAVNNWAANPLAKELYGGIKLLPGLLEPGLKINNPSGMLVLELLLSLNPKSSFAMVRAVDISGEIDG